jgi:hypothetical protein
MAGDIRVLTYAGDRAIDAQKTGRPSGVSAAPKPSIWAMLLLGFFGIGFMTYRPKQNGRLLGLV